MVNNLPTKISSYSLSRNIQNHQSFDAFRGNTMYYLDIQYQYCFSHDYHPPKHSFRYNNIYPDTCVFVLDGNPLRIEHNSILHTSACNRHCSTVRIISISIMTYRFCKISTLVPIAIE